MYPSTVAQFEFSQLTYTVTEAGGAMAMVVVELAAGSGELTFDIEVTVTTMETAPVSAEGMHKLLNKSIYRN